MVTRRSHRERRNGSSPAASGSVVGAGALGSARRRRATELAGLAGGLVGVALTLVTALLSDRLPDSLASSGWAAGHVFAPLSVVICLLSWAGLRTVSGRWYGLVTTGRVLLEIVTVVTVTYVIPESVPVASVLAMPVLAAGARLGLRGAVVTWAATLLTYVTVGAVLVTAHAQVMTPQEIHAALLALLFTAIFGFLAAWTTGSQTSAANRHLAQLEAAQAVLEHQATHDALTGLANRQALYEHAAAASGPGALLAVDLDGFKAINDTYGHAAGDEVLQAVAGRLRRLADAGDLAVRMGGDEFVLVLAGADEAGAARIADQLRTALAEPITTGGGLLFAGGGSVGVALWQSSEKWDIDALAAEADARMYRAKAARRSADARNTDRDYALTGSSVRAVGMASAIAAPTSAAPAHSANSSR